MRKNTCELIRCELDELNLDETCSTAAIDHLRECGACREFHEKQTKLRQIIGSLGTVAAPADFDFRLRARLANESSSAASHFSFVDWVVLRRGLVTAAVLLVFATGAFLVRNVLNRPPTVDQTAGQVPAPAVHETPKPAEIVRPESLQAPKPQDMAVVQKKQPHKIERSDFVAIRNKPLATKESASTGATVVGNTEPLGTSEAFPIDASSFQSFKVLVDDGRGNAKTISVPTISFGSQRLMQNANHYAPKRVW
jgi:hypothetical protein